MTRRALTGGPRVADEWDAGSLNATGVMCAAPPPGAVENPHITFDAPETYLLTAGRRPEAAPIPRTPDEGVL